MLKFDRQRFELGNYRPYIGEDGKSYVIGDGEPIRAQKKAKFTLAEWDYLDSRARRSYSLRTRVTRAISEVSKHSLEMLKHPLAKTILEHETMTEMVDMDGIISENGSVKYQLQGIPLPLTWSACGDINKQSGKGSPQDLIDTLGVEASARRIGELIECSTLGLDQPRGWGINTKLGANELSKEHTVGNPDKGYGMRSRIYGLINFPNVETITLPFSGIEKSQGDLKHPIEMMIEHLKCKKFHDPYVLVSNNQQDSLLDSDDMSSIPKGSVPYRTNRVATLTDLKDKGLSQIIRADVLSRPEDPDYILFQLQPETVQIIDVMQPTVIDLDGVYTIISCIVPRIRADWEGNPGIVCLKFDKSK